MPPHTGPLAMPADYLAGSTPFTPEQAADQVRRARGGSYSSAPSVCNKLLLTIDALLGIAPSHHSLHSTITTDARDWSASAADAWIYGIVVGWTPDVLAEIAKRYGWRDVDAVRLSELHMRFSTLAP